MQKSEKQRNETFSNSVYLFAYADGIDIIVRTWGLLLLQWFAEGKSKSR